MKRKYILIISMIILIFSLSSCAKVDEVKEENKENEAINQVGKSYFSEEEVIAVILNNLDNDKISNYKKSLNIEEYGDSSYESALIIPKYNNMKISVYTSNIDGDKLIKDELLYETKNKENYGFLFKNERPEGIPLIITLEGEGINVEYMYSYNGKDGTPEFELIKQGQ